MNTPDMQLDDELRELYRELILDHAQNPRHFGRLSAATHFAEGINPLCGDKLKLYLRLDEHQIIEAASFEGSGCAISMASASLLTDVVIGLSVAEAEAWFAAVTARLAGPGNEVSGIDLGKIHALDGVRDFPSRIKCATLAWHALDSAVHKHATPASTE